jgi:hypothetical protein
MEKKSLNFELELPTGIKSLGEITTHNDKTYVFKGEPDVFIQIEKEMGQWYQVGHENRFPPITIDMIGFAADKFIIENPVLNKVDLTGK